MVKKSFFLFFLTFFLLLKGTTAEEISNEAPSENSTSLTKDFNNSLWGLRNESLLFESLKSHHHSLTTNRSFRNWFDSGLALSLEGSLPIKIHNSLDEILLALKNTPHASCLGKFYLNIPQKRQVLGTLGIGNNHLLKFHTFLGAPLDDTSVILHKTHFDSDQKNYFYKEQDLKTLKMTQEKMVNNDQYRVMSTTQYQKIEGKNAIKAGIALLGQKGGQPGVPGNSLKDTREDLYLVNAFANFRHDLAAGYEFFSDTSQNVFSYQTREKGEKLTKFTQSSHELVLGMAPKRMMEGFDMDFAQRITYEHAYEAKADRIGLGLLMNRNAVFSQKYQAKLDSYAEVSAFANEGFLLNKDIVFSMRPFRNYALALAYNNTSRFPSLFEAYAQDQVFKGNKNLEKESIYKLSLLNDVSSKHLGLGFDGFFAYIGNGLHHVLENNRHITPKNSGRALRGGVSGRLLVEPIKFIAFSSHAEFLPLAHAVTSKKRLSHAPILAGLLKLRIGTEDFIEGFLQSRFKAPYFADLKEEVKVASHMFFDVALGYQVNKNIKLSLSVDNIFNYQAAEDHFGRPIRGATYYGEITLATL